MTKWTRKANGFGGSCEYESAEGWTIIRLWRAPYINRWNSSGVVFEGWEVFDSKGRRQGRAMTLRDAKDLVNILIGQFSEKNDGREGSK